MDRIEISSPSVDVAALRGEPPIAPADAPGAAPQDPDESPAPVEPAVAPRRRPSRVLRLAAASGIGLLIVLGLGVGLRLHQHGLAAQEAQPSGGPRKVLFARARPAAAEQTLELPGTVRAIETSLVYGLVGGMVSEMHVHIGDRVKKGQLLALLAAPDMSQQLSAARAQLREAEQNVDLVQQRSQRYEQLAAVGVAAQQEAENARLSANSARAAVERSRAEMQRFGALAGYQRVTAPFDGTVTRRLVDPGVAVVAGVTPLLELATADELKALVEVPQTAAAAMQVGSPVEVVARGLARSVSAKVLRTAGALDPVTRTLRVELALPRDSGLLAGAYVTVRLKLARPAPALVIPAAALSARAEGLRVAVLNDTDRVELRPVKVQRDFGREVELEGELATGTRVVLFPPVDLTNGDAVAPVEQAASKPAR